MKNYLKKPKLTLAKPDFSKLKSIRIRKLNLDTILALLSYFHILVIIPLFMSKNRPFVAFHVKQGVVLLAFVTISIFFFYIPILPWFLIVFYIVCLVWGIVNVFLSKEKGLPVLGRIAKKL